MGLIDRAGRLFELLTVKIAVRGLEFGFEPDAEFGKVDQTPAGEGPERVLAVVLDADEEMHGVIGDFESFVFRLEVEGAECALDGTLLDELGIEVEDQFGFLVDDSEVRVARALVLAGAVRWDLAHDAGNLVEVLVDGVFEKLGSLVDPPEFANG